MLPEHSLYEDTASLILRLGSIFSPAAPINQATLFAGRKSQVEEIADAVNQAGLHAVLFGERGVGKTSLANVIPELLNNAGIDDLVVSKVNCDSADSFSSIWEKVLREIRISLEQPRLGFTGQSVTTTETLNRMLQDNPSHEDIRYLLQGINSRLLLVIDEYDRLGDATVSWLIADTIKALSDHSVGVTIILVGVADNVGELIAQHESIDRCLVQVHMPRMSSNELADILDKGLAQVEMDIDPSAKDAITFLSQGLPHYAHLLGLTSARASARRNSMRIEQVDVGEAINSALRQAQQSIMISYTSATASSRKDSLFKEVLLSCALSNVDAMGYFAAGDVQQPMSRIMGKSYQISAFARHLDQFCQSERGPVLQKYGERRRYRYRFINPLLQPYVIFHGLSHGLITMDTLIQMAD